MATVDEAKLQELYSECQEMKRKLNELQWTHQDEIDELKKEITESNQLNKQLNNKCSQLQAKLNERVERSSYNDLEERYNEETEKLIKIIESHDRLEKELNNCREENKTFKQLINEKNVDLENFRKAIQEFVVQLSQYQNLEEEHNLAKQTIDELKTKNESLNDEMQLLINSFDVNTSVTRRRQSSEQWESIMKHRLSYSRLSTSIKEESAKGDNLGIILLEERIKELEDLVDQLKSEIDEKDEKLGSFNEEMKTTYEKEISDLKSANDELLSQIEELNKIKSNLETELNSYKEMNKKLEIDLNDKENHSKELTIKYLTNQKKCKDFEKQFGNRVTFMERRLNERKNELLDKDTQLKDLQTVVDRYRMDNDDLKRQMMHLQQECKINEDSFNLERIHKERYLREVNILKAELENYKSNYNRFSNVTASPVKMTFVMPTVRVNSANEAQNFYNVMSNVANAALSTNTHFNQTISSSSTSGLGSNFTSADEEGEFMDPKHLNSLKNGFTSRENNENNDDRLSILQRRNTLVPSHLKSSYPVEYQSMKSKDNISEDTIKRGLLNRDCRRNTILHGIENSSYRAIEYKDKNTEISSTTIKVESKLNKRSMNQSGVSSHFILSCTPTRIIKRVKNKQKWTPSKEKK